LIKDLNDIHGDIIELEPYLVVQEDYDQLTEAVEQPINRHVTKCRSKDEKGAAEIIQELRDNVDTAFWPKGSRQNVNLFLREP